MIANVHSAAVLQSADILPGCDLQGYLQVLRVLSQSFRVLGRHPKGREALNLNNRASTIALSILAGSGMAKTSARSGSRTPMLTAAAYPALAAGKPPSGAAAQKARRAAAENRENLGPADAASAAADKGNTPAPAPGAAAATKLVPTPAAPADAAEHAQRVAANAVAAAQRALANLTMKPVPRGLSFGDRKNQIVRILVCGALRSLVNAPGAADTIALNVNTDELLALVTSTLPSGRPPYCQSLHLVASCLERMTDPSAKVRNPDYPDIEGRILGQDDFGLYST